MKGNLPGQPWNTLLFSKLPCLLAVTPRYSGISSDTQAAARQRRDHTVVWARAVLDSVLPFTTRKGGLSLRTLTDFTSVGPGGTRSPFFVPPASARAGGRAIFALVSPVVREQDC